MDALSQAPLVDCYLVLVLSESRRLNSNHGYRTVSNPPKVIF